MVIVHLGVPYDKEHMLAVLWLEYFCAQTSSKTARS